MTPTISELAASLVACFEGERLTSYQDSGGVWTIGIGSTGPDVHAGMTITHEQAVAMFERHQAPLLAMVAGLPLTKAAALVSFGYNCGQGALSRVLAGLDTITNPRHITDRHGNVLPGLVARRRLEQMLVEVQS